MFTEDYKEETQYLLAKKRVEDLRKFYKHVTVYMAINLVISILKISRNLSNGETLEEALFDFNTYAVWVFWGIAIVIQAFKLFGLNFILGKDWEERQIEKHINKNR
ncbi:2TM domain-containing protein [Tenacibaculum sp. MEBiC06402]|uniref:2TM domain-containing protein n=1 Tax=unclassified Tenacibaculum TaxID=2635139 RepID=UPI003B9CEE73